MYSNNMPFAAAFPDSNKIYSTKMAITKRHYFNPDKPILWSNFIENTYIYQLFKIINIPLIIPKVKSCFH